MKRRFDRNPESGLWLPNRRVLPFAPRAPQWGGGLGPRRGFVAAPGGYAFVQATSSYTIGGSTTPPISLAYVANVAAGSMLVACLRCAHGSGTVTVSDGTTNFTEVVNYAYLIDHHFFYLKNATGGATTLTASGSVSPGTYFDFGGIPFIIAEYSGLSTSAPLADHAEKQDSGSYFTMTTASVTATLNGLLLVLAANDDGDRTVTPDAAFTSRAAPLGPSNAGFQLLEYNTPTSAGATGSLTAGTVVNSYWSTIAAAFSL